MKQYFKIGEISELYHIGADSLRYYEELGILTPKRGKNNYRLYSIHDIWRLNVIRDLRQLGFSMDRIKEYLNDRSIHSTQQMLCEELTIIQEKLSDLEKLKKNVSDRLSTLEEAVRQPIGQVELVTYPKRHCHLIPSGYDTDEEMDMLIKQLLNKDRSHLYIIGNNRIGSRLPLSAVENGNFRGYDGVFIIADNGPVPIEGGSYLRICYCGQSDQNSYYVPLLLSYAKKQNLALQGPILELLWIDIHQSENIREHITELQVRCIPAL